MWVTVLYFLVLGPFIAGSILVSLVLVMRSASFEAGLPGLLDVFRFGIGWLKSPLKQGPWSLFITFIPTTLAAIIYSYWIGRALRRNPLLLSKRSDYITISALLGTAAAAVGWGISLTVAFTLTTEGSFITDLAAGFGSLMFAGIVILPTGAILGGITAWWYSKSAP
jgi:hypothetical protein